MILQKLILENFGLYAGHNELDLAPQRSGGKRQPIILVGGKNGAGKTTLLEAVRLALYGRKALGSRVSQAEYDEYLRSRVHRPQDGQHGPSNAAVGIEFDYAQAGILSRYRVRRGWAVATRAVNEALIVERDGALMDTVPRDEWHQFLEELIPPGVSQLFFFDGEKIREIADGNQDREQLAAAVRGLLGIDLIGRLRTDLGLYVGRHEKAKGELFAKKLDELSHEKASLEGQIAKLNEALAQLSAERESQQRAAENARMRFIAEGGDVATRRSQIEAEAADVKREIARSEAELRDHANRLLPFLVARRAVRAFQHALSDELAGPGTNRREISRSLRTAFEAWLAGATDKRRLAWRKSGHAEDLEKFFEHWSAHEPQQATARPAFQEIPDRASALARLEEAETSARPRVRELAADLERFYDRQAELDEMLSRGDKSATSLFLDELRLAEQRVGATTAVLSAREEELKILRGRSAQLQKERERLLTHQASASKQEYRTELAAKVSLALAEYEKRLLGAKLARLRKEFVDCFREIARKDDLIGDVRVDPVSFDVTFLDRKGRDLPKAELSAGEKQIYAIAILWALARTSGRALPMIIDTPLARLDSDHRENLVRQYFPFVSHQVIMLSTDTEIDTELVEKLKPWLARSYHLSYHGDVGRTRVQPGYFVETSVGTGETEHALQQA